MNVALAEPVGFAGCPVIDGAGGAACAFTATASAAHTPNPASTSTPSNAASGLRLALPAALLTNLPATYTLPLAPLVSTVVLSKRRRGGRSRPSSGSC